jgi:C-terminal processing protease CtpA/Prc
MLVAGVVSHSPAAGLGVEVGEAIERIDGVDAGTLDPIEARTMLLGKEDRAFHLELRRPDGSSYEAHLVPRDYIPAY